MTTEEYIAALKRHDWDYDYSDDYSVWRKGLNERYTLNIAQKALDPDYVIWNQHAPEHHRIHTQPKSPADGE